jgi:hypothetical protein
LGYFVILAESAAEVTADRGDGIGDGTGVEMEQGFLFDGVHILGNDQAVNKAV